MLCPFFTAAQASRRRGGQKNIDNEVETKEEEVENLEDEYKELQGQMAAPNQLNTKKNQLEKAKTELVVLDTLQRDADASGNSDYKTNLEKLIQDLEADQANLSSQEKNELETAKRMLEEEITNAGTPTEFIDDLPQDYDPFDGSDI